MVLPATGTTHTILNHVARQSDPDRSRSVLPAYWLLLDGAGNREHTQRIVAHPVPETGPSDDHIRHRIEQRAARLERGREGPSNTAAMQALISKTGSCE